jgi:Holliday junction resolvase RusA-like endonuclease
MYTPRGSRVFKDEMAARVRDALGPGFTPLDCPLYVEIDVVLEKPRSVRRNLPTVKPDLDNYEKAIMDACTAAGLWRDDCLVVTKLSRKRYGSPSVRIAVRPHLTDE